MACKYENFCRVFDVIERIKPSPLAIAIDRRVETVAKKLQAYCKNKIKNMYCNSYPEECPQFKEFEEYKNSYLNQELHNILILEHMLEGIKGLDEL